MAHKKAGGSTRLGRDSNPKFLGVKKYGGEKVKPGDIIIRQRGTRYIASENVGEGKDQTLFAKKAGFVVFKKKKIALFTGKLQHRQFVSVNDADNPNANKNTTKTIKKIDNTTTKKVNK